MYCIRPMLEFRSFKYYIISCIVHYIGHAKRIKMATPPNASLTATQRAVRSHIPCHVLLVGSIPLSLAKNVFQELVKTLPNRLLCMPDGETGKRSQYVMWQVDLLKDYQVPLGAEKSDACPRSTNLKDIHIGFEDHAINLYREFCELCRYYFLFIYSKVFCFILCNS